MATQRNIEDYFNKSFEFTGNEFWLLPTKVYNSPPWHIDTLQQMKIELNKVKGQLSSFNLEKWSKHTRFRDPSSCIISTLKSKCYIELLTQAWCKFYECLSRYPIVPEIAACKLKLTSLHLCEAPGAFVSALNRFLYTHHRKLEWDWHASTLNPYYEGNPASDMIADDRLIRCTDNRWDFGVDQTGDLIKYYNYKELVKKYTVMLVTADGSVDCMQDPGEQENHVHFLHYCETITALRVLEQWGSFVLKIFTMFEHGTVCLMYLLTCCFAKVHVFKPCSSKSGNSEVYVVCLGYKGWTTLENLWQSLIGPYQGYIKTENTAMFSLEEINPQFLLQLEECVKFFMNLQCYTINENVRHFTDIVKHNDEEIDELKTNIAEHFLRKCRIAFHAPKRYKMITSFQKRRNSSSSNDWDFKVTSVENLPGRDITLLMKHPLFIKIGRAIVSVTTSKFCHVKFNPDRYIFANDSLKAVLPFMTNNYTKIQASDLVEGPQYAYQREFFYAILSALEHRNDIIIVAIPLLTRFLVGVIYVLALSFESVLAYKKGILAFRKLNNTKLTVVSKYLRIIETTYQHVDHEKKYVADILEVVPDKFFKSGNFYELICGYNNGLYEVE